MTHLHKELADAVTQWCDEHYVTEDTPAIAEILQYAVESETGNLRFLRTMRSSAALETYWCLRLKLNTPTVPELYDWSRTRWMRRGSLCSDCDDVARKLLNAI